MLAIETPIDPDLDASKASRSLAAWTSPLRSPRAASASRCSKAAAPIPSASAPRSIGCSGDFRHVVLIRDYDDLPVEGLQIRNLGNLVGIEYTNNLLLHGNRVIKRALDVVLAGLALLVAAPVILVAAALVTAARWQAGRSSSRTGPVSTAAGSPFPKIRTMRRDAETRLEEHLAANPGLRQEWEARYKLRNDPRLIPVVGQLFRRFSIDELPQLWTVLRGDMSLVGPRPFPDYHMKPSRRRSSSCGAGSAPASPACGRSRCAAPAAPTSRKATTATTSATGRPGWICTS